MTFHYNSFSSTKNDLPTIIAKNKPHLKPALDQIERGDGSVSEAAGQDTSEAAESVVLAAAEFARVLTSSGCGTGGPGPHGAGENALHLLRVHVVQVRVMGVQQNQCKL